jgi:hypothetical protein
MPRHDEPASICPLKVILPVHRPPPVSGPVALNLSACGVGRFVSPGLIVNTPVGSAGVPPQLQTVDALAGGAAEYASAKQAAPATPPAVFEDPVITDELSGQSSRAIIFRLRIDGEPSDGVDYLRLDQDALVRRITVTVRPLRSLQALADRMADTVRELSERPTD